MPGYDQLNGIVDQMVVGRKLSVGPDGTAVVLDKEYHRISCLPASPVHDLLDHGLDIGAGIDRSGSPGGDAIPCHQSRRSDSPREISIGAEIIGIIGILALDVGIYGRASERVAGDTS